MQTVTEPADPAVLTEESWAADTFVRSRLTGHFLKPNIEKEYREWLSKKNVKGLCILMMMLGAILVVAAALAMNNVHSFKGMFLADYPEERGMVFMTTFVARGGLFVLGILLLVPSVRRVWTRTGKLYEWSTFVSLLFPVALELVPIIFASRRRMADLSADTMLAPMHTKINDNDTCDETLENPVHATRSAYWSCTTSDFMLLTYSTCPRGRESGFLRELLRAAVRPSSPNLRRVGRA